MEALLLLRSTPERRWTTASLSRELRNNPSSVEKYVKKFEAMKVLRQQGSEEFVFDDSRSEYRGVIDELVEADRVQRHKVYELVHSPLKRARDFSDAFLLSNPDGKKED